MGKQRLPKLPSLVERKIYKTSQSRGASTNEIYQNRVKRNNTVLIPHEHWDDCRHPGDGSNGYEKGYIVLVQPEWYFSNADADAQLAQDDLVLGENALLWFRRRTDWMKYGESRTHLENGTPFQPGVARTAPLGGVYLARIPKTTAKGDADLTAGYNSSSPRGAGIRVFEYASAATCDAVCLQLEALFWLCEDAISDMNSAGMTATDAEARRDAKLREAKDQGLLDVARLKDIRALDDEGFTMCPLCRERIPAATFLDRTEQAVGREVVDLTTTDVSLFHIQELRVGVLQHKPYNLGWGHHFCNVVVKDAGIMPTIDWMRGVLANQPEDLATERESVEEAVGAAED